MQLVSPERLRGVAADLSGELERLQRLPEDIVFAHAEIAHDPGHARLFYENLALKLHNLYTGCERIFQTVAAELDGAQPSGFDWQRRLLERTGAAWGDRPTALPGDSIDGLREFLAFRHVVRSELDEERIERLIARYPVVWGQVEADLRRFIAWSETLAD